MSERLEELEDLIEAYEERVEAYHIILGAIRDQDPEMFQAFIDIREECDELETTVIAHMKDRVNDAIISDNENAYKVSTNKSTAVLDLEEAVYRASQLDHIDLLLEHGVLTFKGSAANVERLPSEIRPIYERCIEYKDGSTRVTMPKRLKRVL